MQRHPSLPHELHRDLLVLHTALAREIAKAVTGFLGSCLNAINSLLTRTHTTLDHLAVLYADLFVDMAAQELSISGRLLMASSALPEVPPPGPDDPIFPPDALTSSFVVPETCPACREPIALVNIRNAVCPNGHKWGKSTALVRCQRAGRLMYPLHVCRTLLHHSHRHRERQSSHLHRLRAQGVARVARSSQTCADISRERRGRTRGCRSRGRSDSSDAQARDVLSLLWWKMAKDSLRPGGARVEDQ